MDFIKQKDAMQCGVACLSMVCHFFGKRYSAEFLQRHCRPTAEGVSLLGIKQGAEAVGLEGKAVKLPYEGLADIDSPMILHWNQNHFIVIIKSLKKDRFKIADPAKGIYTIKGTDLRNHWISTTLADGTPAGIALQLSPTKLFYDYSDSGYSEDRSWRFLAGYFIKYKSLFLQIVLCMLLGCVLQLTMPFLTQAIVDKGIRQNSMSIIWIILIGELVIVTGATAGGFIRRWLLLHISARINISMLSDFIIRMLKLPMDFFDTRLTGDLMQRMGDHTRIQSFLTNQTLNAAYTVLCLIIYGVVLWIYSFWIFMIFTAGVIVYAIWEISFLKKRRILDFDTFSQQAKNQNLTFQMLTSMQEIKQQGCGDKRRMEWEDNQADLFEIQTRSMKLQQTQEGGAILINEVRNLVITVMAAATVISGEMSLGAMLAVQYIIGQLNGPVDQLMGVIYSIQDVGISLERINEINNENFNEDTGRKIPTDPTEPQDIVIRNLSFKYDIHSPDYILEDISLIIPKGKVTAVVGTSGSGKTTFLKLLLGFYRPQKGEIRIGDIDLSRCCLEWWRKRCGAVMQDGVIFNESIADNIASSDLDKNQTDICSSAETANIREYIESLPLKYNTIVGTDGKGLSQGQKQRLLIARAVYRNPEYIFLDEATNSLDANNEKKIVERLERFYRGKTVIIVAHRLSTVANADNIVVLDKGRIVEQGSHEELVRNKGFFYSLIKNQLELGT